MASGRDRVVLVVTRKGRIVLTVAMRDQGLFFYDIANGVRNAHQPPIMTLPNLSRFRHVDALHRIPSNRHDWRPLNP